MSVARRLFDPIVEISRIVNTERELRHLQLHPLQRLVPPAMLDERLERVFIGVVNSLGVNVNQCYRHPWMQPLLNFVAGFGPRKARALLEAMNKTGPLVSRQELLDSHLVGDVVFRNCAAFLKVCLCVRVPRSCV